MLWFHQHLGSPSLIHHQTVVVGAGTFRWSQQQFHHVRVHAGIVDDKSTIQAGDGIKLSWRVDGDIVSTTG